MKKLRVLLLVHSSLVPPREQEKDQYLTAPWRTEHEVEQSLIKLGHEVRVLGMEDNLSELRTAIHEFNPQIAYNLLVEFQGVPGFEQYIIGYLEMKKVPYTGCNPRGLLLSGDKALAKKILNFHRIPSPKFFVVPKGHRVRMPKNLTFPLIVKSLVEDASMGISQSSVVRSMEALEERTKFIHESIGTDAIIEQFVGGRELYVGVIGNRQLTSFPVWELDLTNLPKSSEGIATSRVKWNEDYRKKHSIRSKEAKSLTPERTEQIQHLAKRVYRRLGLSGYARVDFRLDEQNNAFVIEANPNPGIATNEEFPDAAKKSGLGYDDLNQKILNLGLSWFKSRM